ncbi:MaoC/PaaZ C-terminal domain-containing protein [Deinococcus radiopugnans]|uniref:MaoC/PaaZ C-terminal domain-containing protein n=1 Tax=Deinococcus radiopugnans TaxID=57497 RepID=UPI00068FD3E6|nr:MaoC/PaaZ C-terminal domain-containing protein [Deinococcus radiopugnans]
MQQNGISSFVGMESLSDWLTIDQEHLSEFSHSTYLDPAHVDLTASRNHALGPELVDGFLLLSLLVYFNFKSPLSSLDGSYGFNYGLDRVRFTSPVFLGEPVRVRRKVTQVVDKTPTRTLVTVDIEMEAGRESPRVVMVARWLYMLVDGNAERA